MSQVEILNLLHLDHVRSLKLSILHSVFLKMCLVKNVFLLFVTSFGCVSLTVPSGVCVLVA